MSNSSTMSSKQKDSVNAALSSHCLCVSTAKALQVLSKNLSQLKGEQEEAQMLPFTGVIKTHIQH